MIYENNPMTYNEHEKTKILSSMYEILLTPIINSAISYISLLSVS